MSFARRAMQLKTALRLPALAMQLPNVVKTLVLCATKVPKHRARYAGNQCRDAARDPGDCLSRGFAASLVLVRTTAMPPRTTATRPPKQVSG
jgi:hypothetical protein